MGVGDGEGIHGFCYVSLMRGEFDDNPSQVLIPRECHRPATQPTRRQKLRRSLTLYRP